MAAGAESVGSGQKFRGGRRSVGRLPDVVKKLIKFESDSNEVSD